MAIAWAAFAWQTQPCIGDESDNWNTICNIRVSEYLRNIRILFIMCEATNILFLKENDLNLEYVLIWKFKIKPVSNDYILKVGIILEDIPLLDWRWMFLINHKYIFLSTVKLLLLITSLLIFLITVLL